MASVPPVPNPDAAVGPRCAACGSDDIVADAWAGWDVDQACWVLDAVFDHTVCGACGAPTTLVWSAPARRSGPGETPGTSACLTPPLEGDQR